MASTHCITAVLVPSPVKHALAFIHADIPGRECLLTFSTEAPQVLTGPVAAVLLGVGRAHKRDGLVAGSVVHDRL